MAPPRVSQDVITKARSRVSKGELPYWTRVLLGSTMLLMILPFFAVTMGSSVVWYFADFGATLGAVHWIDRKTRWMTSKVMRNEADGFVVWVAVTAGVLVPSLAAYNLWYTVVHGFNLKMWFVYHLLRVGPMAMHFAIVNTLAHKEGHSHLGLFTKPYHSVMQFTFNWWAGTFYGLAPSTYTYGHSRNHHQYNNEQGDVVSTADMPRDNFLNYLAYIPRWFAYHINVTTYLQFSAEQNTEYANKMLLGSAWYCTIVASTAYFSPLFAVAYMLYPLLETGVFLSCINWAWHAFMDLDDPSNEYVMSLTIFGGPFNVLNEDYHVVHHQYPGTHWTKHPELFEKHRAEYIATKGTIFDNMHAFEVFLLVVLRQYKWLATKFVDLDGKMTMEEKTELLTKRLRMTSWSADAAYAPPPKEIEHSDPYKT